MTALRFNLRKFWRRLSRLDLTALALSLAGALAYLMEMSSPVLNFLKFFAALAGIYLLFRLLAWGRSRLLWSLRNRLIVAGLFIAVIPVLLLLLLAARSAGILYSQLASYLLYEDIQRRKEMLADIAEHIAAAHEALPPGVTEAESERILAAQSHAVHDRELTGLSIEFSDDPIQLNLMLRYTGGTRHGVLYTTNNVQYEITRRIVARNRFLQPALLWIDSPVNVVSRLDSAYVGPGGAFDPVHPVLAVFNARPSQLSGRMFGSLGELRDTYLIAFVLIVIAFLVIWAGAFSTGIVLTRQITKAVDDLYKATQDVKRGHLSHRVRIERRDQLGVLGESFNDMIGSVSTLIQEQQQRQRLENEISIAREVQDQLFPRSLPQIPGVEIEAICKAAREVSGDYYDFIQLSPTHLAIAIADISGKGISAALLMASLQAALRSQVLVAGSETMSTAELVARLNKHLVRNTADDRFATFFIAVYDSATRTLRYTNAGHLPSFLICRDSALHLDKGGMVLGVMEDYCYEEGSVIVAPDSLLVGYSDGLVEPENVYGEEFGIRRLQQAAVAVQGAAPQTVAQSLMTAAEEWAGTPEQADDMTVIVSRFH